MPTKKKAVVKKKPVAKKAPAKKAVAKKAPKKEPKAIKVEEAVVPNEPAVNSEVSFEDSSAKVRHEIANAIVTFKAPAKLAVIEARKADLTEEDYQELLNKV